MGNNKDGVINKSKRPLTKEERIRRRKVIEAKKKRMRRRKIFLSILTIIFILILSSGVYAYSFISGLKTNTLGTGEAPASSSDPINILVLGMDVGDSSNEANKSIRRSDTIMVFNYNPSTKKAHIVSIPRDTMIEVDAYMDNGEFRRYWKINSAYVLGAEEEIITHVESLLNLNINYIVEVDYNAFRNVIDAIGGIEMTIEQDMHYDDDMQDLHIHFNAGETVLLDGKKAEEFFRWRGNNDGTGGEDGDIGRINNQHQFLSKVIDKVLTPSIVVKAPKILKAISDNVDTNIPAKELISLGMKMLKLKSEDIIMTTLKGNSEYIYGESFVIADEELNIDLINALNASDGSSSESITAVSKESLKVLVLNGTKIEGLASNARDKLQSLGYSNVEVGNTTTSFSKSIIETDKKDLREIIGQDLDIEEFGKISESEYKDYDIVVILGEDYNLFGE